jgi:hypothetical protein
VKLTDSRALAVLERRERVSTSVLDSNWSGKRVGTATSIERDIARYLVHCAVLMTAIGAGTWNLADARWSIPATILLLAVAVALVWCITANLRHLETPFVLAGTLIDALSLIVGGSVGRSSGAFARPWHEQRTLRVLLLLSKILPEDLRASYVEEQYANITAAESADESFNYLADQVVQFPKIALIYRWERRRARSL